MNHFFAGMETSMGGMLHSQAMNVELVDGKPFKTDNLTIAKEWDELPPIILNQFDKQDLVDNQIRKIIDGIPIVEQPKAGYFVMRVVEDNQVRYAALVLNKEAGHKPFDGDLPPFFYIITAGFGAMAFFAVALVLVQRNISTPLEQLKVRAKGLDKEQLTQPVPNFHYSELNTLAELIRASLSSVQESLEREQRFLGYASHELRTPIAVTRTNSELLRKMIIKGIAPEKQLTVLDRIERAGYTMTDLTETLLWLNRQEGKPLPSKSTRIGELVKQVESELHYLLQGKLVEVQITIDEMELELPESLCRIVITNLVRNAFQHTQNGYVEITQKGSQLFIVNHNLDAQAKQDELGFGLGLELTERLIAQSGWEYVSSRTDSSWQSIVIFESSKDSQ